MAGRRCPGQGCPRILTNGERYCPTHLREYEIRRGNSVQRGYDSAHKELRIKWQQRMDEGKTVRCATCAAVLNGKLWDLGHNEARTAYIGPQCQPCNRADGGRRGAQARR